MYIMYYLIEAKDGKLNILGLYETMQAAVIEAENPEYSSCIVVKQGSEFRLVNK